MVVNNSVTTQKNILVTGASGAIGRNLVRQLIEAGHNVTALARKNPERVGGADRVVSIDLTERSLPQALVKPDTIVIHLAAKVDRAGPNRSVENSVNVKIARNVVAAQPKRLIVLSSIAAALAENSPESARQYGLEKAAADHIFRSELQHSQVIILRPPAVYGKDLDGPIATLASLVKNGIPIPLGAAKALRPYMSINNLTSLVEKLVFADPKYWVPLSKAPLEVHDGTFVATRNLVGHLAQEQGAPLRLVSVPLSVLRILGSITAKAELVSGAIDAVRCEMPLEKLSAINWSPHEAIPDSLSFLSSS